MSDERWWFWIGYPGGRYNSYGAARETYQGAFEVQTLLERDHPAFWHRWRWTGSRWVYEGTEKVTLLRRATTPILSMSAADEPTASESYEQAAEDYRSAAVSYALVGVLIAGAFVYDAVRAK